MRKGRDRGKTGEKKEEEKTDENSGHYVIASSRPLERRTLAPIIQEQHHERRDWPRFFFKSVQKS